ncbi:MAG TPA: thiamine pyrophosphate-binding protein, partial [Acidimicrobiales bacterium]|nr:thiamine pyrophosphate-binding protein [Acidimicrobiales bacterium]
MQAVPGAQDIQAAFATVLVDEWCRCGTAGAVVSPGSRSTPLLVALAEAAEAHRLPLHVVLDERDAGFFALGLGLQSGIPALVVTTSGTAAVELHPAVVEADRAGVPLLAITADRPGELHDCGAPQTIDQVGLFGGAVRWARSLGVPEAAAAGSWRPIASRALAEARGRPGFAPGPVHLNLAFREPLLGDSVAAAGRGGLSPAVISGRPGGAPWHRITSPDWAPAALGAGGTGLVVGEGAGLAVGEGTGLAGGEGAGAAGAGGAGGAGGVGAAGAGAAGAGAAGAGAAGAGAAGAEGAGAAGAGAAG